MKKGLVFDIQKYCTHDGPGIRTTVFLKGCNLNCAWCHNPESIKKIIEIYFTPEKCINCGNCVAVCENGAHLIKKNKHFYSRKKCTLCLKCAGVCDSKAVECVGKEMTSNEVIKKVKEDFEFYEASGGGLTLSGGEPFSQFEFTLELLKKAHAERINTCVETNGAVEKSRLAAVLPYVDLFLYDIKDTGTKRHKYFTGAACDRILENLKFVDSKGKQTILRCLMIKGVNLTAKHLANIANIYMHLKHCKGVELLPYHPYGTSKAEKLGASRKKNTRWIPSETKLQRAKQLLLKKKVEVIE